MANPPVIEFELLKEERQVAVSKAVEKRFPDVKDVRIKPLNRFGFTGAQLLLLLPSDGMPFVVKVHAKDEIKKDHEAIEGVQAYYADTLGGFEPVYNGDVGVSIYRHFGADTAQEVEEAKELKDVAYNPKNDIGIVTARIKQLYEGIAKGAHRKCESKATDLRSEYRRTETNYLRTRKSTDPQSPFNSTERIQSALGDRAGAPTLDYLGETIDNPLVALKAGFSKKFDVKVGPIHGDLHPSNVIFSPGIGEPHLIDFSWARKSGHIIIDFVLMETSLRFMLFPRPVCLEEQCGVDKLLLEQSGYREMSAANFTNPVSRRACKRMAKMVGVIREAAEPFLCSSLGFDEYLAAQFLVLYGLLRYENYDFHVGLRALGLIARHLRKRGLLNG